MAKKFNLNFIRIIIILVCLGILATYGKDVFIRQAHSYSRCYEP